MRIIGLDLGTKSLGISISDDTCTIATGIENFNFKAFDYTSALNRVKYWYEEYHFERIVIGKPLHLSSDASDASRSVDNFVKKLNEAFPGMEVIEFDERFTTKIATSYLLQYDLSRAKRKKVIDKVASEVILQDYLDSIK